jgi:hypothetical protein
MRLLIAFSVLATTGCSALDNLNFGEPQRMDPNRVYLGSERLLLDRHDDVDRFTCLTGRPLLCRQAGVTTLDCRCM